MRMRHLIGLLLGLAVAGTASAQTPGAAGKSRLQKVLEAGVLRVGTTGDFRPMT